MNLCECGCGQECKNRFIKGHNLNSRQTKENTETQTYYPDNYESMKTWLSQTFDRYFVHCRWEGEKSEPSEIILTGCLAGSKILVGKGDTFTKAANNIMAQIEE